MPVPRVRVAKLERKPIKPREGASNTRRCLPATFRGIISFNSAFLCDNACTHKVHPDIILINQHCALPQAVLYMTMKAAYSLLPLEINAACNPLTRPGRQALRAEIIDSSCPQKLGQGSAWHADLDDTAHLLIIHFTDELRSLFAHSAGKAHSLCT